MHNSIEVINDLVFDIINFKNTRIIENNMGFSLKSPNALVFFTEGQRSILVQVFFLSLKVEVGKSYRVDVQ